MKHLLYKETKKLTALGCELETSRKMDGVGQVEPRSDNLVENNRSKEILLLLSITERAGIAVMIDLGGPGPE
jgi:hypothetical protein